MTFTATTIRKLRALGLDQETFDAVLAIFEDAQQSKPKKNGNGADREARGTRLADDWALPAEWREWALSIGLQPREVTREAISFKSYWLNCAGGKGLKLKWNLTWQTWCRRMLERAGRPSIEPETPGAAAPAAGPEAFTDATWKAISRRHKSGGDWKPEWGPPPGRMDCQMPAEYL